MRRRVRVVLLRLAAVLFGLIVALLMIEIGLRLLYGSLPMTLQIALRDVRMTPFSNQRLAPPPLWQSDTDYQTIMQPGAVNSLQAGSPIVLFHVDSYAWWNGRVGFRSPQPQNGIVDAIALGDSHTFCFTEVQDCWVNYVAQQNGLNLSNLGQPVTGSLAHARLYEDFVAKPDLKLGQPKLVLWQFYGNDYNDDYGLAALNGTAKSLPVAVATVPPLPQSPLAIWLREHSVVYALLSALLRGRDEGVEMFVDPYRVVVDKLDISFGQSYLRDAFDMTQPRNLEGEQFSHEAILKTRATVEKNDGKFMIILVPTKEEVYRPLTEPKMGKAAVDALAAPRLRLLDFCAAQQLTCFDLLPALQIQADQKIQLYFPTDPHLNVEGNRVVGTAISEFLQARGLIKLK